MGSYVFGAAASDDIAGTINPTYGTATLMWCGWFKPTTLTATRHYWSVSNTGVGLQVGPTTSELRYLTDGATTDGLYDTTGAGIVVNEWVFLAGYMGVVSNPLAGGAMWVGRAGQIPTQVTLTQTTAMVGSPAGGTALTAGNQGANNLAFQGNIGWLTIIHSAAVAGIAGLLPVVTPQAPTQAELDMLLARHVIPMWQGNWSFQERGQYTSQSDAAVSIFDMTQRTPVITHHRQNLNTGSITTIVPVVSGATFSEESPPTPCPDITPGIMRMVA